MRYLLLFISCLLFGGEWCEVKAVPDGENVVLQFTLAGDTHIYSDTLETPGAVVEDVPPAVLLDDGRTGWSSSFTRKVHLGPSVSLKIRYEGCSQGVCYLPVTLDLSSASDETSSQETTNASLYVEEQGGDEMYELDRRVGYMNAREFVAWLSEEPQTAADMLSSLFAQYGIWLVLLALLPLGALLNLTPCILPMMPLTLAIIGAGGKQPHPVRNGLLYGCGMAIAYGALGVVAVLTGSQFASFTATAWFNGATALIFILLGLAMFDVFSIDFTRWRKTKAITGNIGILLAGALTALLAGACVAPVLVWTLLLAIQLHADGQAIALFLPLALGIGLGLPWPIVAAGISRLPRPGGWMVRIRQAFGVLIIITALWYGWTAVKLALPATGNTSADGWLTDYDAAIAVAQEKNKPILLEFTTASCKSCVLMEKTTFADEQVQSLLQEYIPVKIRADLNPTLAKQFHITGAPTFIRINN